jgi:hypothetical protein
MTIVRISAPGSQDRLAQIGVGTFTLGSDFGCDLALIDEGVAARHLTIEVGNQGVFVRLAGESPAAIIDQNGTRVPMVEGQGYPMFLGASVNLAGLTISVAGPAVRLPPAEPTGLARLAQRLMSVSGRSLRNSMIGLGTLVATGMFAASVLEMESVQASATQASVAPVPVREIKPDTPATLRAHLEGLGVQGSQIIEDPSGSHTVIHVSTTAEHTTLASALRGLPFEAKIVVGDRVRMAVETILAASEGKVKLVSLDKGRLVLSGLSDDPERRARMIEIIQADISGVTEVTFEDPIVTPADELTREIVAVWPGPYPYVVLADGRRVREGEVVAEGLTVSRIASDGLVTLQMDDHTHDFRLSK